MSKWPGRTIGKFSQQQHRLEENQKNFMFVNFFNRAIIKATIGCNFNAKWCSNVKDLPHVACMKQAEFSQFDSKFLVFVIQSTEKPTKKKI